VHNLASAINSVLELMTAYPEALDQSRMTFQDNGSIYLSWKSGLDDFEVNFSKAGCYVSAEAHAGPPPMFSVKELVDYLKNRNTIKTTVNEALAILNEHYENVEDLYNIIERVKRKLESILQC
jgi:hypothetical protein